MDLHAQVLLRDPTLSPNARESATQIRTEARQLNRMILNLLDLAKADEGQLAPKPSTVELAPLVEQIFSELRVTAERRRVVLESRLGAAQSYADPDLLRRALTNLVENAVRYAPPETAVTVSSTRLDGATELRVADAGNGVPPEMREKVFDPFVQIDAGEQLVGRGGRGLGLTFCKRAVEAHGGTIWIEDGAPGAVFCMRFSDGR
jgi:signal transduction histidine kinase